MMSRILYCFHIENASPTGEDGKGKDELWNLPGEIEREAAFQPRAFIQRGCKCQTLPCPRIVGLVGQVKASIYKEKFGARYPLCLSVSVSLGSVLGTV